MTETYKLVPKPQKDLKIKPFKVEVQFEHGDADFMTTETFSSMTSEQEVIDFYLALKIIKQVQRSGCDQTSMQITKQIQASYESGEFREKVLSILEDIPYDAAYEGSGTLARVDSIKIFCYNTEMLVLQS